MSQTTGECFLCGSSASYEETDYANRRFYRCPNDDCGEYEISLSAMTRLEHNSEFKQRAIPKAKSCKDTENILEIIVRSGDKISASVKPRSAGPG